MAKLQMSEMPSILQHGTATPYLAIFDGQGNPFRHPISGVPLGAYISKFSYKFDPKKNNECAITFDCGDPDVVGESAFKENSKIMVQWGYIYSDGSSISSDPIVLYIRDYNVDFDDSGVHSSLICLDIKEEIRKQFPVKPNGDEQRTLDKYLENGCDDDIPVIIERFDTNDD